MISGIKLSVMGRKLRLRGIEVADVVFRTPRIEQREDAMFDIDWIGPLSHDIFLMKDMAEEMSVVELGDEMLLQFAIPR